MMQVGAHTQPNEVDSRLGRLTAVGSALESIRCSPSVTLSLFISHSKLIACSTLSLSSKFLVSHCCHFYRKYTYSGRCVPCHSHAYSGGNLVVM